MDYYYILYDRRHGYCCMLTCNDYILYLVRVERSGVVAAGHRSVGRRVVDGEAGDVEVPRRRHAGRRLAAPGAGLLAVRSGPLRSSPCTRAGHE